MPKFHKLQRGVCLTLFASSSIASYFNPHMIYIAGISLFGVICFDVICLFRDRTEVKDHTKELEQIQTVLEQNTQHIKEMKSDVSIGKLASTFRKG